MKLEIKNIIDSLNKAFFAQCPYIDEISLFKENYATLLKSIKPNDNEETLKDYINIFFRDTYYKNKFTIKENVNNKDLVIYNGKDENNKIGVIIETKALKNNTEMITINDFNKKAFQELIQYYLEERIINNNIEIKHLIITNSIDWFIFNASEFERIFYHDKTLLKNYNDWYYQHLESKNKDWFYSSIAKPFIENEQSTIACTYFNLNEFDIVQTEHALSLCKIFSPEHLLKLPFQNDSNTLNRDFYNELLHIIGLQEIKVNNVRRIERLNDKDRKDGSFIENTINILLSDEIIHNLKEPERFGETEAEQLFSIGLELCITWLNRIIFLKLLESQLVKYNSNKEYFFLNYSKIRDFEELRELFFEVLAVKTTDRKKIFQTKYEKIPYLNSSLFELTELEKETVKINQIKSHFEIPIFNATALKDDDGKRITGSKPILQYLFEFLDSYNFASDNKTEIQEKNKTIINSSVLGLIFEKINGYKEGSYYTPGFVTMYMCRENIRKAIIEKFNSYNFDKVLNFVKVKSITDLFNQIDKIPIKKANEIFNSIKICDPAVGSGHFLVSALNELIAIKSELKILTDKDGKKIRDLEIEVINDELFLAVDSILFAYNYKNKESQTIQETIFHEKQKLIENCLFGVDINPKSVNICRLRLWIELLKNAYYTKESNFKELETLPNIDINIKCGNSLVSHFAINGNGTNGNGQSLKTFTQKYKQVVADYKNTTDRNAKRALERFITELKENFARTVNPNDEDLKNIRKIESEIGTMPMFFNKDEQTQWQIKLKRLENEKLELQKQYNEKLKSIYSNSFEWRFEFPEVLDDNGYFIGFDLIIGNPPYISFQSNILSAYHIKYFYQYYHNSYKIYDSFALFIDLSRNILSKNGIINFICPSIFLLNNSFSKLRKDILKYGQFDEFAFCGDGIFDQAVVPTIIFSFNLNLFKNDVLIKVIDNEKISILNKKTYQSLFQKPEEGYNIKITDKEEQLLTKIKTESILSDFLEIREAIKTGDDKKYISEFQKQNSYPIITGRDFNKYVIYKHKYIEYTIEELSRPTKLEYFTKPKLFIRRVGFNLCATYDDTNFLATHVVYLGLIKSSKLDLKYILALINSKLLNWIYGKLYPKKGNIFPEIRIGYLRNLPIVFLENNQQKPFIKLVDKILEVKKENPNSNTQELEQAIDKLVYKIYNLTFGEIEIIENETA